jgi:hypothetical protein
MSQLIIENVEAASYETHEVPFGRIYEWHPGQAVFECDAASRNSTRKQAEKVKTHARVVVELLEQARELMVEDNAVQPALEHLHATLREAEDRAAMLESWYRRTYLSGPVGSAPPGR